MYKGLCTILITINIAATIVISLLVCFFFRAIRLSVLLLSNVILIQ